MATMDPKEAAIRVEVPPRSDALHLLRSVAASVAARLSMPLDDVEELRIAVDEAATLLLEQKSDGSPGPLEMELVSTDAGIHASLRLASVASEDDLRASWPWRVISGVTQEASIERADGRTTISFVKTAPGSDR